MPRVTPAAQAANFRRQLDFVGAPMGLDAAGLQALRIAAAAGLGVVGMALGILIGSTFAIGVCVLVGVAMGFYLPVLWLDQLLPPRRAQIGGGRSEEHTAAPPAT